MDAMRTLALRAIDEMPPISRLRAQDAEVIARHRDALLALEAGLIRGFYDTVYGHPVTARVFKDGEREDREHTLTDWWRRTVNGPLDEDYFAWMALVGLVHVIRRVSNPMMLSMVNYVRQAVVDHAQSWPITDADRLALTDAFGRLGAQVAAVITYSYDHAVVDALFNVAGMPPTLLERLRDQEVASTLSHARNV